MMHSDLPENQSGEALVSVVIASYNMGPYLPLAVQSALDQTYRNIEIIVVDDGSKDNTAEMIEPLRTDSRVRYIYQENQGQTVAKNRGIRESSGSFVAFLDADDVWLPLKLERQMPLFEQHGSVGVTYTNVVFINENGEEIPTYKPARYSGRISGQLLIDNFVPWSSAVVRRECFDRVGVMDEQYPMGIDYDLWLRISAHFDFVYVDEVLLRYRCWSGQMSHNYRKRFECAIRIMNAFLDAHPAIVDPRTVNEAWAHTFTGRGICTARIEKKKVRALKDYGRALSHTPSYIPAWKAIVKLIIGRP